MRRADLRAARANRDSILTVTVNSRQSPGLLLSKITDCARMCFSSVRNRRSARTGCRPRKFDRCSLRYPLRPPMSARDYCALRAPTLFSIRIKKRIRIENRVMDKSNNGLSLLFIQNWNSATTAGDPKQRPACAGLSLRINTLRFSLQPILQPRAGSASALCATPITLFSLPTTLRR